MRYHETILDVVGNTPLVRLPKLGAGLQCLLLAKLEQLNPGGSVKDRIGLAMIEAAERSGALRPGGTIIEPTSGNTGHGLAMAAAIKGYRTIFVLPDKVSTDKIALLKAYGAEVVVCPTNVDRESPQSYYSVADRLVREIPRAFQPNQYFNPLNPEAHYRTTGPEIWEQTEGRVTTLVASMGTGGTISGTARFLKEQRGDIRVVGADPEGSIYSGEIKPYKVEGVGEDFMPGTMDLSLVDEVIQVSDRDSFLTARALAREEGILVGGSSGLALHAALEVARRSSAGDVIVVILPDTGRNYLSKIFSDDWMRQNGYLARLGPVRIREVLAESHGDGGVPRLVTVAADRTVGEAIDLMQQYGISQMPVVGPGAETNGSAAATQLVEVVGSLQQRTLLDRVFRDPSIVSTPVADTMDPPFSRLAPDAPLEDAFEPLLRGETAVMVVDGEQPMGVLTGSDLLGFVAHHRR